MPKHHDPTLDALRAFAYFGRLYIEHVREVRDIPGDEHAEEASDALRRLTLSLIPDDDEDTPGALR